MKYEIPREADEHLLMIWRWCIAVGDTFTIREARWAARLMGLRLPVSDLRRIVLEYAVRERASELLRREEVNTSDLDAQLAFVYLKDEGWIYSTAFKIGIIDTSQPLPEELVRFTKRGGISPGDVVHPLTSMASESIREDLGVEIEGLDYRVKEDIPKLSEEGDIVYALWLRAMSKGSKWGNLSKTAKKEIARRLYEEILIVDGELAKHRKKREFDQKIRKESTWEPSGELLDKVGLIVRQEVSNEGTTKKASEE